MPMVRLIGNLWALSGKLLTHAWDANSYLIDGDEPTLIDCGSTEGYGALRGSLLAFGYAPGDIRRVFATHGHWDHVSAMAQLRQESDAHLLLHAAERPFVESGDFDRTGSFLYDRPFPPVKVDQALCDGDRFDINGYAVDVIHTPGHSPGSVSFLVTTPDLRVLITGDTMWGGFSPRLGSDIDKWCASLDRLLLLQFDALAIGHSSPMLIFDAMKQVREARNQLGVLYNPWFKPYHTVFRY
ncbi:MAG: hypothetical protein NVS4B8_02810 [Herpetosiphon sp.]